MVTPLEIGLLLAVLLVAFGGIPATVLVIVLAYLGVVFAPALVLA